MSMDDAMVAWFAAQLDQIEQTASSATPGPWRWETIPVGRVKLALVSRPDPVGPADVVLRLHGEHLTSQDSDHIESHSPDVVLAQVQAGRRLVAEYRTALDLADGLSRPRDSTASTELQETMTRLAQANRHKSWATAMLYVIGVLAEGMGNRPGYREEWRP